MAREFYDRVNKLIGEIGSTKAYQVKAEIEDSYSEIGFFSRFFSYFIPNSWTKAGQLRSQMAECDQAFKDNGYKPDIVKREFERADMNSYAVDGDLYKENEIEKNKNSSWTKSSENAKNRKLMRDMYIAEDLDLNEYKAKLDEEGKENDGYEDDMDELEDNDIEMEQISVEEASSLNVQSKENVKVNDTPSKVVENQKEM